MKNTFYFIALCLLSISILFIACKDETVIVQQICGPYKTTQMKIKVSVPAEDTEVDMQFSIFQKASIHWGDGVVEDANTKLSHVYRDVAEYMIEVKAVNQTDNTMRNKTQKGISHSFSVT